MPLASLFLCRNRTCSFPLRCTGKCCRPSGKSKRIIKNRPDIYICSFLYSDHFLQHNAHMTAISFLHDSRCEELLILLSYTFPFASIHSCICGYSLGLKQTKIPAVSQLLNRHSVFYSCFFSVITAPAISWIFPSLLPLLVLLWGRSLHLAIACTLYTTQLRNKCRICFLQVLSASIFPGFSDTPFLLLPAGYYWTFCKV